MNRRVTTLIVAVVSLSLPGAAAAQGSADIEPNLNWVFLLAVVTLLGFLAFLAFVALYYVLAVIARNRRFATQAVSAVAAPAAPAPAQVAAPAPTPAAQPAAPAPAAAAPAASAPAQAPAPEAAPSAPASGGGVPRVDANALPDGVDAVTRGRLKKLAVLQERGQEPPADLLEELKDILPTLGGSAQAAAPAPATAPAASEPAAAPAESAPAPAADTGGLPRIDPLNLPDGIDAVARGRLKKLAVFQERGDAPPADLIEKLKPILDEIGG